MGQGHARRGLGGARTVKLEHRAAVVLVDRKDVEPDVHLRRDGAAEVRCERGDELAKEPAPRVAGKVRGLAADLLQWWSRL